MGNSKVHLINEVGDKIVIEGSALADDQLLNENKYSNYDIDVDWYLSNGYMTLENMRKSIENGNS